MNRNHQKSSFSMEDLWPGHILIHLHGNADSFKLHTGRLELLDTDVMFVGQIQGKSLYSVLSSYQMQIAFVFTVSQHGWVYRTLWVMLFSTKLIKVHALSCTYIHNLSSTYAPPGNLFCLSSTLGICEGFHFLSKNLSTKVSFVDCWLQVWKLTSFVYIMDNKPLLLSFCTPFHVKRRAGFFVLLS